MARTFSDTFTITTSITRPADTNAYAAGDQVANSTSAPTVLTFTGAARYPGWGGKITKAEVLSSAYVAIAPDLELWVLTATATPNNDNAAFAPTDAVAATAIARIPVSIAFVGAPTAGAGGNQWLESDLGVQYPYQCAADSQSLYGLLIARNAYVPVSGEIFTVRITCDRD